MIAADVADAFTSTRETLERAGIKDNMVTSLSGDDAICTAF